MKEKNKSNPTVSPQFKHKEPVQNNISKVTEKKIKDFIPDAVNPNNGAAYETFSDPLSSKGN